MSFDPENTGPLPQTPPEGGEPERSRWDDLKHAIGQRTLQFGAWLDDRAAERHDDKADELARSAGHVALEGASIHVQPHEAAHVRGAQRRLSRAQMAEVRADNYATVHGAMSGRVSHVRSWRTRLQGMSAAGFSDDPAAGYGTRINAWTGLESAPPPGSNSRRGGRWHDGSRTQLRQPNGTQNDPSAFQNPLYATSSAEDLQALADSATTPPIHPTGAIDRARRQATERERQLEETVEAVQAEAEQRQLDAIDRLSAKSRANYDKADKRRDRAARRRAKLDPPTS